jgi:hypothetical protein
MVSMRFLKDDSGESLFGKVLLIHVPLDKALFEEFISRFDPFPAKAFLKGRVRWHFLYFTSKRLSSDLFTEATT